MPAVGFRPASAGSASAAAETQAAAKDRLWTPSIVDQSMPRFNVSTTGLSLVSGTLRLVGNLVIAPDATVTTITFVSVNGASSPTHWWYALVSAVDLSVLGKTADQTTTAWGAGTDKPLNLATAYTNDTGDYLPVYAGVLMTASTLATMTGIGMPASLNGVAPTLCGNSDAGLTVPSGLGATASAPTAAANHLYCRLT